MHVVVHKPGILTTMQDLGRRGKQDVGVPVSGAIDDIAFRLANAILGNDPGAAALEITLIGPKLEFTTANWIAISGADLSPSLIRAETSPSAIEMNKAVRVESGDIIEFGKRRSGLRAYLAVGGGFQAEELFGSVSTHVRSGLGGLEGRAIKSGDRLYLTDNQPEPPAPFDIPHWSKVLTAEGTVLVRFSYGREYSQFTDDSLDAFVTQSFSILPQSDRMAYRLKGPSIRRLPGLPDILSEAVTFGTVQVPPSGQPIILMADRQTTGGYPRIAQISQVDLPILAQLPPGQRLKFRRITLGESQALLLRREAAMSALFNRNGSDSSKDVIDA